MTTKIAGTLQGIDETTRSVGIIASTPQLVQGEALLSWDLTRFLKNPVVLFAHDLDAIPIGRAYDIVASPEALTMRVRFATADANPEGERIWNCVKQEIIRGISVQCELGAARKVEGGTGYTDNVLLEVSFVPVPMEEDALTIQNEEARKKAVSAAASALAKSKQPRTDTDDAIVHRLDRTSLGRVKRTQVGGARVPARLSRTGVLTYRNADGTARRELRLPEEVFHADSLATLDHAPVIDIKDHTGMVTPETWRKVSLGHVVEPRRDGKYIASDLLVQDQETLDAIERGDRTEISLGYECRLDASPGVYEGEAYDCVQRAIRYNHAALCPPNRGRAGPDVGLRFDQQQTGWAVSHLDNDEDDNMKMIRLDGKDYEVGSDAHIAKIEEMGKAAIAAVQTKLDAAEKAKEELQGRLDTEKKAAEKAKDDFIAEKKKADDEAAKKDDTKKSSVKSRMRKLVRSLVLRALGDEDDDESAKEKKLDSLVDAAFSDEGWKLHMVGAIKASDPQFNADGKTDGYIEGRFDALDEIAAKSNTVDNIVRVARDNARHLDAADDGNDSIAKARKKRDDNAANAWKPATANGEKR